jgi:subfamily B ATP-binding cassette protein MsbA
VNQQPGLFNDTISNNIKYNLEDFDEKDIIEAAKIANALDFIQTK